MAEWTAASNVSELRDVLGDSAAGPQATGPSPPPVPPGAAGMGPGVAPQYLRRHRGGTVLALGILGLVLCVICGIIAWSMGNTDLKEMVAGRMDPSGEGLTKAGKICGMISTIVNMVMLLVWLLGSIVFGLG